LQQSPALLNRTARMSHKRVYARVRRAMAISGTAFPQNIELAAAVADLIYIMDKGRMVSSPPRCHRLN